MANDTNFQIDPSLNLLSGTQAQSSPDLSLFGPQNVARAQPVTFQDLRQYLGQSPPRQMQQPQQTQQKGQQVQPQGRAPATVRYNNPGGMWPGPSSKKFGGNDYGVLRDGNLIAKFDDPVKGAAAQFDLLDSKKYVGRQIGDLIGEWSGYTGGKKNVAAYAAHVANSIGVSPDTRLTPEVLRSPQGIAFAKAQAQMETGYDYPLSDDQWKQAQSLAFGKDQVAQAPSQQLPQNTMQIAMAGGPQFQDLSQYLAQQ